MGAGSALVPSDALPDSPRLARADSSGVHAESSGTRTDSLSDAHPDSTAADSLRATPVDSSVTVSPDTTRSRWLRPSTLETDRLLLSREPGLLRDSTRLRLEIGASTDYTNEIYYLDSLATPTLVQRQRFDTPQTLTAGVLLAAWDGTRAARGTGYSFTQEVAIGERLQRATFLGRWRQAVAPDWRWLLLPRAEYRRDRSLGRDFEEYQAGLTTRLRHELLDGATAIEGGLQGDWLHTAGSGAELLADRWTAGAVAALDRSALSGLDGRLEYTFRVRGFPDSSMRDHLEHETQLRLRAGWGLADFAAVDLATIRRFTIHLAPTSLDNFWEETALFEIQHDAGGRLGAAAHVDVDAVQFDVPDAVLYFDHQEVVARAGPRWQPHPTTLFEAGPRLDWLGTSLAPEESYLEFGGYVSLETIAAGALWTVTPSAGRRRYPAGEPDPNFPSVTSGHSSYDFVELELFGDQRIPGGCRARLSANGRWELHDEAVENATSLYFSVDVRRLF